MITILQGKDMAAMDSNGKLVWGYVFSQIKFVTEDWRLQISCEQFAMMATLL